MSGEKPEVIWNVETANFEVEVFRRQNGEVQGWFEHNRLGDALGGGLWFEELPDGKLELQDYDGVFELPKEVQSILIEKGIIIPEIPVSD